MSPPRSVSMKLDARARSSSGARQQVLHAAVAAQRDHVRMLDQQQLVGDLAPLALLRQLALQRERVGVGHAAECRELAVTH